MKSRSGRRRWVSIYRVSGEINQQVNRHGGAGFGVSGGGNRLGRLRFGGAGVVSLGRKKAIFFAKVLDKVVRNRVISENLRLLRKGA